MSNQPDPVAPGRVAVVTGAASGIGLGLATRFAAEGMHVGVSVLGATPAEVAGLVVDSIRSGRFYILTAQNRNDAVIRRGAEIVAGGPPELPVSFI